MTRLIDADRLEDDCNLYDKWDAQIVKEWLKDQPTVDAEPVRHGRWKKAEPHGVWVYSNAYRQCSECNAVIYRALKMNYCPNCGSRMVGGEW